MTFIDLNQMPEREIVPGYHARFVHSDHMTLAYWRVEAGAQLKAHSHPHEQILNVFEGQFEVTIDGETRLLQAGEVATIPSNVPHAGRAVTECRLMDAFWPVREEYR